MGPKYQKLKANIIRESEEERDILNTINKTSTSPSYHTGHKGQKQ